MALAGTEAGAEAGAEAAVGPRTTISSNRVSPPTICSRRISASAPLPDRFPEFEKGRTRTDGPRADALAKAPSAGAGGTWPTGRTRDQSQRSAASARTRPAQTATAFTPPGGRQAVRGRTHAAGSG